MLPLAILSGGQATRLRPLTERVPKAMVRVAGEPFIGRQLRGLRDAGATHVVLLVGHLGDQIHEYVGDGSRFGLQIDYSWDGAVPMGTAGAVRHALPLLGKQFLVLYGDSYLMCDFAAVEQAFLAAGLDAMMTVLRNDDQWDRSNVEFEAGRIIAYDKVARTPRMRHIDYGLGAFRATAFAHDTSSDLAGLYRRLLASHRLSAFEVHERFFEIGSIEGLRDFERHLSVTAR